MEWGACFMGFLCLVAFEPWRQFGSKTNGFCDRDIFDEREGDLSSPGYPHRPPTHAVSCRYNISVKSGYSISLNFSDKFHIESAVPQHDAICPYHWLRVTIPGREPIKLCGDRSPGVIDTNSSRVSLDYRMDGKGLSRGWSLHFSTRKVQCPHPGRVTNGRGPSSRAEFFYGDRIFVRCHQGHKVMMGGQLLESFSTTCQENGQWRDRSTIAL
ncbi:mannan-binding lectin serine protease 2-like [Hippocampus zosterae]|uniref:mannan-binding lectin serine protease 2-like n=1 Tax=Hippocampus zosterae TaxID=109293 RepID=UPI00223C9387|nr:mannan-binding lectin serine protease 2-like [Hippocampus zosterae]